MGREMGSPTTLHTHPTRRNLVRVISHLKDNFHYCSIVHVSQNGQVCRVSDVCIQAIACDGESEQEREERREGDMDRELGNNKPLESTWYASMPASRPPVRDRSLGHGMGVVR